jgi:CheY-specific phosphatase CheX
MTSKLEKELYRAAVLTFEELGLMLPTPEVNEEQQKAATEATVTIPFDGPFSGRLVVTICGNVLGGLAANMLGEDEASAHEHRDDALGEIGNVICGNILPRIAGSREVFDLRPPYVTLHTQTRSPDKSGPPAATTHVGLDSGRADLALYVDSGAVIRLEESAQ